MEQDRRLPYEQRNTKPFDTCGLSSAQLTDNDVFALAYDFTTGRGETKHAAWARRLKEGDVARWSRMKTPTRNIAIHQEYIFSMEKADLSMISSLSNEQLPVFALTVRALLRRRKKSLADYERRHHLPEINPAFEHPALPEFPTIDSAQYTTKINPPEYEAPQKAEITPPEDPWKLYQQNFSGINTAFKHPVPPRTGIMTGEEYDRMHNDWEQNRPLLDKLWQAIEGPFRLLRRVVPAVFVIPSVVSVAALLTSYSQPESTVAPTPLLRDQAKEQPAPNLTKTAPPEVIKAHEIAQSTIANLPKEPEEAEILFRIWDERTGKPLEGIVEFDGQTAQTNGAGLIHMKGKTLRSFEALPKSEILKITLKDGSVVYVEKEVRPGLNSTLLNPEKGFIRITLTG